LQQPDFATTRALAEASESSENVSKMLATVVPAVGTAEETHAVRVNFVPWLDGQAAVGSQELREGKPEAIASSVAGLPAARSMHWTDEEIVNLRESAAFGKTATEISIPGRSRKSIRRMMGKT
jgi:hypothetical protein